MKLALLVVLVATSSYQQGLQQIRLPFNDIYDADDDSQFHPSYYYTSFGQDPNYFRDPLTRRQESDRDAGYDSIVIINPSVVSSSPSNIYNDQNHVRTYASSFQRPMMYVADGSSSSPNYLNKLFIDNNLIHRERNVMNNKIRNNNPFLFRNYQGDLYHHEQRPAAQEDNPVNNYESTNVAHNIVLLKDLQQKQEIQSERMNNYQLLPDPQRFFFNPSSKLFIKTIQVTFTSTVQFFTVVPCLNPTIFEDGTAATPCIRNRRSIAEQQLLDIDDNPAAGSPSGLSSTPMEKMMETTMTPYEESSYSSSYYNKDNRDNEGMNSDQLLSSSKDDLIIERDENDRDRRSFYYSSITTTFTTYSFASTVLTESTRITLPLAMEILICVPRGYVICK